MVVLFDNSAFLYITLCFSLSAEYYVKVMNKVKEKGDEYIQSESDRLGRMMS